MGACTGGVDTLHLDPEIVRDTAGIMFKQRENIAALGPMLDALLVPEAEPATAQERVPGTSPEPR